MDCISCSKSFKPFVHNQTRCRECVSDLNRQEGNIGREASRRFSKECEWCTTTFVMSGPASRYCSKQCNLDKKRAKVYGLDRISFDQLIATSVCDLCGSDGFTMDATRYDSGLVIDHCHTTGVVRGMLCHNCNRALGLMQDDIELLKRAVSYLERATTIPHGSTGKYPEAQRPPATV